MSLNFWRIPQISQIYPNIPSWRSWVGGKSLGQFQQKLDALAQDVLTDPGWNRWKMATVWPPPGPLHINGALHQKLATVWPHTVHDSWFMKIRAREIPTCGENPDWLGFGWAKAATDSETYGFSPRTIGSVLQFSFQITPLYPHGSSIFCWLNQVESTNLDGWHQLK